MSEPFLFIMITVMSFLLIYQLRYTKHLMDDGKKLWESFYKVSKNTGLNLQENTFSGYRLPNLLGKMKNRLMLVYPSGKYTMMMIQADLNLDIEGEINIKKKGTTFSNISILKSNKVHVKGLDSDFDILTDNKKLASKASSLLHPLKSLFDSIKRLEFSIDSELGLIKINDSELTVIWKGWIYDEDKIEHFLKLINDAADKLEDEGGRRPTNKKPDQIESALNPTSSAAVFESGLFYLTAFMGFVLFGFGLYELIEFSNLEAFAFTSIMGLVVLLLSVPRLYIKKNMVPSYIHLKKRKNEFNLFYLLTGFYLIFLFIFNLFLDFYDFTEIILIISMIETITGIILLSKSPVRKYYSIPRLKNKYNTIVNRLFLTAGISSLAFSWVGILGLIYLSSNISFSTYLIFHTTQLAALILIAIGLRWKKILPKEKGFILVEGMGNVVKLKQHVPYEHIKYVTEKELFPYFPLYGMIIHPPREKSGLLGTANSERAWKDCFVDEKKFLDNIDSDKWMSWEKYLKLENKAAEKDPDSPIKT